MKTLNKEGKHTTAKPAKQATCSDESDGYSDDFEKSLNETDMEEDGTGGIDESSRKVIGDIERVVSGGDMSCRSVGGGSDKVDGSILRTDRSHILTKSVNFNDSVVAEEMVDMFMRAANGDDGDCDTTHRSKFSEGQDQSYLGMNESFRSYQYSEGEIPATPSPDKRNWRRR